MMETYCGHVRAPADAIKLFEACRLGLLPRVQRRLSEKERQSIKSGSVFVWDEREAGMRRWTDGKSWSASRVSGSFLTYREMEGKRGGGSFVPPPSRRQGGKTPDSGRGSDDDMDMDLDGPDGYRYKPDGLMKQSFSITTSNGQHLHLISYYARPHANAPDMLQPTTDQALRHIVPVKGMYPESTVHEQPPQGPPATRAPMQSAYSPQQIGGPQRIPYPYAIPPGYGWPPSPSATPPYQYASHGYPSHLNHPPLGSAHVSPNHHTAHYPHPSQIAPQQTVFDRAPPPLQNSSLPPPPAHHQLGPISRDYPTYALNPSPRVVQGASIAEKSRAPAVELDPRITATAAAAIQQSQAQAAAQAAEEYRARQASNGQVTPTSMTASSGFKNDSPRVAPIDKPNVSQAQTIPSISSLIHAHDSPPRVNVGGALDAKSNGSSRAGSTSPGGVGKGKDGPKDIQLDKMSFGQEDMGVRALRTLDRKFCV